MRVFLLSALAILFCGSTAAAADKYSEPADAYLASVRNGQFSAHPPTIQLIDTGIKTPISEAEFRDLLGGCNTLMTGMGLVSREPFRLFWLYGANCPASAKFGALKLRIDTAPDGKGIGNIDVTPSSAPIALSPPPPRKVN